MLPDTRTQPIALIEVAKATLPPADASILHDSLQGFLWRATHGHLGRPYIPIFALSARPIEDGICPLVMNIALAATLPTHALIQLAETPNPN